MRPLESFVGAHVATFDVPVELGKVRELAVATLSQSDGYLTEPAPVVPPAFYSAATQHRGPTWEHPRGSVLAEVPVRVETLVHGGEAVQIFAAPRAGDVLTARMTIEAAEARELKDGRTLTRVVLLTEFQQGGASVADQRATAISVAGP